MMTYSLTAWRILRGGLMTWGLPPTMLLGGPAPHRVGPVNGISPMKMSDYCLDYVGWVKPLITKGLLISVDKSVIRHYNS